MAHLVRAYGLLLAIHLIGNDTQSSGIVETANSGSNAIMGNDLSGNAMGAIKSLGTGTIVRDNLGVEQE